MSYIVTPWKHVTFNQRSAGKEVREKPFCSEQRQNFSLVNKFGYITYDQFLLPLVSLCEKK